MANQFSLPCPLCGRVFTGKTQANARKNQVEHLKFQRCNKKPYGGGKKITDEVIAQVHKQFPSTTLEWDVGMVDACRRPIVALIANKLIWHDKRVGSASTWTRTKDPPLKRRLL